MLVRLRLEIDGVAQPTNSRRSFWFTFRNVAEGEITSNPTLAENLVRRELPSQLERHFNGYDDLSEDSARRWWSSKLRFPREQKIRFRIRRVSYGSMNFLFEVFGISNADIQHEILDELQVFAPIAFNEIFNTSVELSASVTEVKESAGLVPTVANKMWLLINTTLLVPFLIAFGICFVAFNALVQQIESVRLDGQHLRNERIEIVKALVEQNAKISAAILEFSKSNLALTKATTDLQTQQIKSK